MISYNNFKYSPNILLRYYFPTAFFRLFVVVPRMSSGGGSFPSQTCSSDSAHLPSLNLSIKSERSSPEHMPSPSTPPLHHLRQGSPMNNPDPVCRTPPETHLTNGVKVFPKAGYLHEEEVGGHSLRPLETDDGWQR